MGLEAESVRRGARGAAAHAHRLAASGRGERGRSTNSRLRSCNNIFCDRLGSSSKIISRVRACCKDLSGFGSVNPKNEPGYLLLY